MHPTKTFGLIATISATLAAPLAALAAYDAGSTGLLSTAGAAGISAAPNQLPVVIGTVIQAALGLVGVIFLILMVYAGIRWMTAMGDEGKVERAKDTMINAMIGIVVVVAAYAITSYVIKYVTQPASTTAPATGTPPATGVSA